MCFAYLFARSKLKSEYDVQREYCTKRLAELSEQLEQLGMKSAHTEPLPCKIGDTLYITPCLVGEKSEEIKKVTVTNMQYYDVSHETQAEVSYGNGVIGVVNETDFYQTHIVHFTIKEAQEAVERFNAQKGAENGASAVEH